MTEEELIAPLRTGFRKFGIIFDWAIGCEEEMFFNIFFPNNWPGPEGEAEAERWWTLPEAEVLLTEIERRFAPRETCELSMFEDVEPEALVGGAEDGPTTDSDMVKVDPDDAEFFDIVGEELA